MSYLYSSLDRRNLELFKNYEGASNLKKIKLEGEIRGLNNFEIEFQYPISVFAGKNGSGKTTILSMAACAFHNKPNGFKLLSRKVPYYTFSDFFIQSTEDIQPSGIVISYYILSDSWAKTQKRPDGRGLAMQRRIKRKGGKWNAYDRRITRNVVYLGIDRVVPHSEKSVAKSYSKYFRQTKESAWENDVKMAVGKILSKNYDKLSFLHVPPKLRLPVVVIGSNKYSGFNMGAGENTLFEIFANIFSCPEGSLFIFDEIELGLHEEAQVEFISVLKEVCLKRKIQIISTTHSQVILNSLPPEARFFIDNKKGRTEIISGISAHYAGSKLKGTNSHELSIYVEDNIAESILKAFFVKEIRERVNIVPIGSTEAVIRHLAAKFHEPHNNKNIAIIDGDKSKEETHLTNTLLNAFQNENQKEKVRLWLPGRILFLPSSLTPEKWVLNQCLLGDLKSVSLNFGIDPDEFKVILKAALTKENHKEFYFLVSALSLSYEYVMNALCVYAVEQDKSLFKNIEESIMKLLDQ